LHRHTEVAGGGIKGDDAVSVGELFEVRGGGGRQLGKKK
jgi:hypothetical protein